MGKYIVVWNTEDCCDSTSTEYETLEAAKNEAKEIYYEWLTTEQMGWCYIFSEKNKKYKPVPSEKQIEDWDYMYFNCYVYIREVDEDGNIIDDEDYEYWLDDDELEKIGWMKWSELKKKNNW